MNLDAATATVGDVTRGQRIERPRLRLGSSAVVGVAALGYLVAGLALSSRMSLWGDEAFTAQMVRLPWSTLQHEVQHIDINMAVYYAVVKLLASAAGFGEAGIRLASVLAGTGAVIVAGYLGRLLYGPIGSAAAAVALAVNPFFLKIGLTARPYALLTLLVGVSLVAYLAALRRETVASWTVLALIDVTMLYVHLLSVLFIVTQALFYVLAARRIRREQLIAAVIVAAGAVPAVLFAVPNNTLDWIPPFNLGNATHLVSRVSGGLPLAPLFLALLLAGLVVRPQVVAVAQRVSAARLRYLALAFAVLPVVGVVLLLPVQSLFIDEYFAAFLLPGALLVGGLVASLRHAWWSWAVVGLVALAGLVGVARAWDQPALVNQDWRAMNSVLNGAVRPGDAVAFPNTFYRAAAEYYARDGAAWQRAKPVLPADPWDSQPPRRYDTLKRLGTYRTVAAVQAGVDGERRVWLVGPQDSQMALVRGVLAGLGYREVRVLHVPSLVAVEYERPTS